MMKRQKERRGNQPDEKEEEEGEEKGLSAARCLEANQEASSSSLRWKPLYRFPNLKEGKKQSTKLWKRKKDGLSGLTHVGPVLQSIEKIDNFDGLSVPMLHFRFTMVGDSADGMEFSNLILELEGR